MSFDKIFDLTAGVYFYFYKIGYGIISLGKFELTTSTSIVTLTNIESLGTPNLMVFGDWRWLLIFTDCGDQPAPAPLC